MASCTWSKSQCTLPLSPCEQPPPPPPRRQYWRPNSADFANFFCRFVGFLDFADLFCQVPNSWNTYHRLT